MKRTSSVILPLTAFLLFLIACTRIDTTELGDDLIPVVDNVNTFDTTLSVITDNRILADTFPVIGSDDIPVGEIYNDPEFGKTVANAFFTVYPDPTYGRPAHPFNAPDSVEGIDSVVLQLAVSGVYGDTNNVTTFFVQEISQSSAFKDSAYLIGHGSFATDGVLGSKAIDFTKFNDSLEITRKGVTEKVINVMRIPLATSLGVRFKNYVKDLTANGGFYNDSVFRTLFRGIAITVDSNNANNRALAYININDAKSKLQVYYRTKRNGVIDTAVANFVHIGRSPQNVAISGTLSTIRREAQHGYATYLTNGNPSDDRVYIQTTPGSYAQVSIPGLSTLSNRVIHRAELIFTRIASPGDAGFPVPNLLFLDMITNDNDSAFTIQNDFVLNNGGANFGVFGGALQVAQQNYRFNVSRHVQGIITRGEPNYNLRLYAPYLTVPYYIPPGKASDYDFSKLTRVDIPIIGRIAAGRVVLHGGAAADPTKKARLYIIYSKI
ncbi:MAG TPA: DUF4270 family protein [Chitinophagaceae bacterium]